MQTFMPYSNFKKVSKCLDYKRLGKQRVEAWQIYLTLQKIKEREDLEIYAREQDEDRLLSLEKIGWENHPIVKMWKGYELGLLIYGLYICNEWARRGYNDNLGGRFWSEALKVNGTPDAETILITKEIYPDWIYDKELQRSHQSNLVRKLPHHYKIYFPNVPDNLEYKWIK